MKRIWLCLFGLLWLGPAMALQQSAVPPKFTIPWGNSAGSSYIRSIPTNSQIGISNCAASLTDGFPPLTFTPVVAGGCPPFGQDWNGIFKQITQWSQWQSAGSPVLYDSAFSAAIGGYPKWAALSNASTPGCYWVSSADNNTSDPDTGGANWLNTCAVGGALAGTLPNPTLAASATTATSLANSALQFGLPVNLQINASVAANALTVALVGNNGSAPSSSNPILISFRDATLGSGDPVPLSVVSALSLTIASGSTMDCIGGRMCRLWLFAMNNSGAVALCAYNANNQSSIIPPDEAGLSTAASGTSGGNSAQTMYCSASAASGAIRYIGYIDIEEATAGIWNTPPSVVQLFGPGIKRPSEIVKTIFGSNSAPIATTSTTPQPSNVTASVTLFSQANPVIVHCEANGTTGGSSYGEETSIFRGSTLISTQQQIAVVAAGSLGVDGNFAFTVLDFPAVSGSIIYMLKFNSTNSGSGVNLNSGQITLEEIMG